VNSFTEANADVDAGIYADTDNNSFAETETNTDVLADDFAGPSFQNLVFVCM
jgi:hypothetical protein